MLSDIKFIRYSNEFSTLKKRVPAPLFRKSFNIRSMPVSAKLTVSGLGFYEAHINGIDITKGFLAPYRSNHDHYIYFDEYEISNKLNEGENCLGFILGNGMQNAWGAYIWDFDKVPWRGAPILGFALEIEYDNGVKETIFSNEDVKTHYSPIISDDIHYGECYDATLEIPDWDKPNFDDSKWKNSEIAPVPKGERRICESDPIVKRGELKPVDIFKCTQGYIYDFGEINAGICQLKISGKRGQKIGLKFFEIVKDSEPFFDNIRFISDELKCYEDDCTTHYQENEYICSGNGVEIHVPRFCYAGFRYVLVTGITEAQATKDLLTYILISSDIEPIGTFECDNEIINKIQEITLRSDISNLHYFPTDCPQREKNGWTGDASLSAEQLTLNFYTARSFKEWLKNIYKAQTDEGVIPGIIPTHDWGYVGCNGPAWDSAFINLPYYAYKYTGDISVFDGIEKPLIKYIKYIDRKLDDKGLIHDGLGDWCETGIGGGAVSTPYVVTNTVYSLDNARKASFIFGVLGNKSESEFALALAQKLLNAIRKELVYSDKPLAICETQTAQAMMLYHGIFTDDEKETAVKSLVSMIEKNNGFMKVGVLGSRVLFRTLAENGYVDLALNMITRPEFPSYGNWVLNGATTLWECFLNEDKKPSSLNHHFWGDVSAFFYIYLAGLKINPTGRDAQEVNIMPYFAENLNFVKATQKLPKGELSVEWKRIVDKIEIKICVPNGVHGKVILPNGEYELKSATYTV